MQELLETPWQLLQEAVDRGLRPDATTFGTLLAVCAAAGKWERALELYEDIKRGGTNGVAPGIKTGGSLDGVDGGVVAGEVGCGRARALTNAVIDAVWDHDAEAAMGVFEDAREACYRDVFHSEVDSVDGCALTLSLACVWFVEHCVCMCVCCVCVRECVSACACVCVSVCVSVSVYASCVDGVPMHQRTNAHTGF